jgi:glycosyltransferase involved in cell wall biosynthesis
MKITVICNDTDYFLRHRLPVVDRLVAMGADVTVMSGGRRLAPGEAHGWRFIHVPIVRFSFSPLLDLWLLLRSWLHFVLARPEAVHLITLKPAVFCGLAAMLACALVGRPRRIVVTIPGLGRAMSPSGDGRVRALIGRVMRLLSSRPGTHFTFETEQDRQAWIDQRLIRRDNASVFAGAGVDPRRFYPPAEEGTQRPLRVLFASRLLKSKGLDAFLAAARLLPDRSAVRFLVAGMVEPHDPDGIAPQTLAADDAISFLGEVRDMPRLLREVDIVCLPTRYGEGVPRILIEAAATGLPSIATDLDGCRTIVKDGQTGFLLPLGDATTLAAALRDSIEKYLLDPDLALIHGRTARQLFGRGGFREEMVIDRFIALLTRVADDPAQGRAARREERQ